MHTFINDLLLLLIALYAIFFSFLFSPHSAFSLDLRINMLHTQCDIFIRVYSLAFTYIYA